MGEDFLGDDLADDGTEVVGGLAELLGYEVGREVAVKIRKTNIRKND